MMQNIDIGDSSDDEIPQPMMLNPLTAALLAQNEYKSPEKTRKPKLRISRNTSASNTPVRDSVTPAPTMGGVKRTAVRGAPMRRLRRTPQSEDDHPPSQDQENMPMSVMKADSNVVDSVMNMKITDSAMKAADSNDMRAPPQSRSSIQRQERPVPLQERSANTPRRPAPPPPPPKMSVLETATASAGAATTKNRKKRSHIAVNGKHYLQLDKIGRGGSSAVYRVMAENNKLFALKRVKLEDADESAVIAFKGEIDLLKKLKMVERVVSLYDHEDDQERKILSVVSPFVNFSRAMQGSIDPFALCLQLPIRSILTTHSSWNSVNPTSPA
jgi:serine/threonine-protein kinase TTK/MPS1